MSEDELKPVAYDAEGKPLFASPEAAKAAVGTDQSAMVEVDAKIPPDYPAATTVKKDVPGPHPQIVHMARMLSPEEIEIPPEIKTKHDESVRRYPSLNLSSHEYIISVVHRHPIGMFIPAAFTSVSAAIVFALMFNYPFIASSLGIGQTYYGLVLFIGILIITLLIIAGYAAIWVFMNNRFFLTNESVIQEVQEGLFNHREQTASLMNIEDAGYTQHGPLQTFLDYGTIRLSTEGDETTYVFEYVANPKDHIAILNDAVESFKNGRPVGTGELSGLRDRSVEEDL